MTLVAQPVERNLGLSRRQVLRLTTVVAGAGTAAGPAGIAYAGAGLPVRKEVGAATQDVATLGRAVGAMRALPSSDPRSYSRQVALHARTARHRSWLFLPWHRAHLHYFEEICRELTGTEEFALPYWNWTANPAVPPAFAAAPLAHGRRRSRGRAPASFVGPTVIERILDDTSFLALAGSAVPRNSTAQNLPNSFMGPLEAGPHNYIHRYVGGDMATLRSAPRDPLFWVHHARVDELWAQWHGRGNANTTDPDWLETTFTEFCDRRGVRVRVSVAEVTRWPARYDSVVAL